MVRNIDVSKARKTLSSLMEKTYFEGEKFVLLRRGIPMAVIVGINEIPQVVGSLMEKKTDKGGITAKLFGIWKKKRGSTVEIAQSLRRKAWESHVS